MATDLNTFFDLYAKPSAGGNINRDSFELKYAAAALMIACAKADFVEDPAEEEVIVNILQKIFHVSDRTLEDLVRLADTATTLDGLTAFTDLVNEHYSNKGKFFLIENLWRVAFADGRIDQYEVQFIDRIATLINVGSPEIAKARKLAGP